VSSRWADEPVSCADPECPEPQPSAQPEADGDLRYYACACGMEFGYEVARQDAGACQLGIPEQVRRAASIEPGQPESGQPVFIGSIGRRP
jgi:hypothetical protein